MVHIANDAASMDALRILSKEECASGMGQWLVSNRRYAQLRDVEIRLEVEEFVGGMGQTLFTSEMTQ